MNDENLIPLTERTKSEQREIARLGGIKSGETRRKKKDTAQLINLMLTSKLDDKSKAKVKQLAENLDDEDLDVNAYRDWETDRKSTRLNSSHSAKSRMPSSA